MDLLEPRYEVLALWPSAQSFYISEILDEAKDNLRGLDISVCKNMPHLFRELNWWEERTVYEMPQYVTIDIEEFEIVQEMQQVFKVISAKADDHGNIALEIEYIPKYGTEPKTESYDASLFCPATREDYIKWRHLKNQ